MCSRVVLNLKSKDFNSMYSSSFIETDLPFMLADILTPAKILEKFKIVFNINRSMLHT